MRRGSGRYEFIEAVVPSAPSRTHARGLSQDSLRADEPPPDFATASRREAREARPVLRNDLRRNRELCTWPYALSADVRSGREQYVPPGRGSLGIRSSRLGVPRHSLKWVK